MNPVMSEREIFTVALEKTDENERRAFLDSACGDDRELRERIELLLKAESAAGDFLEVPPQGLALTIRADSPGTFGESLGDLSLDFLAPSEKPGCVGTLGQYEIVGLVGRGGFGLVLRAYDTKLNRVVAIKVMAPDLATNPRAVKRFLREAQSAAAVRHDHVVTIHAIEESHRPPFIVMEYVDGVSLKDRVDAEGELELIEVLRIGKQMALGLAAAHKQGLVHRDIKPANILLENGIKRVKITDFGLARAADDIGMTQTGMIAGTPQFMSPEQAMGHSIDARSDLFSLGSVLFTLCTGRPPFRADSAVAVLRRVCDDKPRSICSVNPDVPKWLEAIVMRLLSKSPEQRFQSADEVADVFDQCLQHVQSNSESMPSPPVIQGLKQPLALNNTTGLRNRLFGGSLFVPLALLQVLAIIGSLIAALIDVETIIVTGTVFAVGLGAIIAVSAWRAKLPKSSIAFGLSSIAFAVFVASVINAFGLSPRDVWPLVLLVFVYSIIAVPWGLREASYAFHSHEIAATRSFWSKSTTFLIFYTIQLLSVAAACIAALLDSQSIAFSALVVGLIFGLAFSILTLVVGKHAESRVFAFSVPAFTIAMSLVISSLSWNTIHQFMESAQWVATAILAFSFFAIPIGIWGYAKEFELIPSLQPDRLRFDLRTALIGMGLIAVACAGARPCLAFGGQAFLGGILFVLSLLAVSLLLVVGFYRKERALHVKHWGTIAMTAFLVQLSFMGLVAAYDSASDIGVLLVQSKHRGKFLATNLDTGKQASFQLTEGSSKFVHAWVSRTRQARRRER